MNLKIKVTIKLFCYLLVSTVFVAMLSLGNAYNKKLKLLNKSIARKNKIISSQIIDIQKKEAVLVSNLDLWKRISSTKMHNSKYITNLNNLINKLHKSYKILNPEILISMPQEAKTFYNDKYIKVIKSEINLHFGSVSDKNVFLFMNELSTLPGYIKIKSFTLVKEKEITPKIIEYAVNGNLISTITGQITFDWYSLLYKT
ncbi:hypothetical protein [Candidatus Mesenet endosymbiont of Agriotes lineatus]|uniref:hypothetical protein n=1 Tax=Candidatus Mesenet endosymbiont of Agriotes lineatus TaxID=3077948 RepID=UPI0030D3E7C0